LQNDVVLLRLKADDSASGGDAALIPQEIPVWMWFKIFQDVGFFDQHFRQYFLFFLVVWAEELGPFNVVTCHIAVAGDDDKVWCYDRVDRLIRDSPKVLSQILDRQIIFPNADNLAKPNGVVGVDESESCAQDRSGLVVFDFT
jgi:hypothetical protein